MLTQENITILTKHAEQTASVDLGLWAALGMEHTDTYWFIKVFSKQTIKCINLQTTFETLNKTFYENLFAYLENYETEKKEPVTLKLPIKTDIETGEIHNLQLISHFLQNAKGLWEIEFFEGLYKEQISEKTKTDWKNFLNIDCIQPTISLQLLKISLLPIPYIKDIASSLQISKLKNLEIFAQKIDEEKLNQLGLILSKIQVPSLHVSLEPEKNLETSVGKFLFTICQNSYIKELKLQSNSAIILNAFPDISANHLKTLDLSGNMMTNLHFLNIALQKNPLFKIILSPNRWLNEINQEKEKEQKEQMANPPIHNPKSFLNALRCHKNSLPKPSIVNTITDLWRTSKDEYAMVCQIENNLCEDRYDKCITLATNAADNTNYSRAFRRLCREITGTLKELTADETLYNFKIV